ncbi:acyltransferase family protein [Flavobacterium sp. TMP13]|uniref:acyltransferase family protein n=1 Tax=Flavobacterium sp. TMP13 TaxID=3425950 RepID=UPI003D77DB5D
MTHQRFYEIDLFRFIAALMVVFFHYTYTGKMEGFTPAISFDKLREVSRYFYMGINFFFIISGFVILMSIQDGSLKKFATSRFLRLFPAYWTAMIITYIMIIFWGGEKFSVTWLQFLANTTMLNNSIGIAPIDSAYWTLFIELKFYLTIGILMLFSKLKYLEHIIALALIISVVVLYLPYALESDVFSNIFPHWGGYFATGCVFYLIRRDGLNIYRGILMLLSLVFIIKQSILFGSMMASWFSIEFNPVVIVAMNTIFFAIFSLIALKETNLFRYEKFQMFGVLTYPLYLIHQNFGYILFNTLGEYLNKYVLLFLNLSVMLIIASLINYYVEKRITPLLKQLLFKRQLFKGVFQPNEPISKQN